MVSPKLLSNFLLKLSVIDYFYEYHERFACVNCGASYKHKRNLQQHVKNECGKIGSNLCDYCFKLFKRKHDLKRHLRSVHKVEMQFETNMIIRPLVLSQDSL